MMKKKSKQLLFALCVLFCINSYSASIEEGNKLFGQSKYDEAIAVYQNLLSEGYEGVDLYYNLANAYYKSDDISHAILYYEKALKIDPMNEDVLYNIQFAQKKTSDKIEYPTSFFIYDWWIYFTQIMSMDNWAIVGVVFLIISLGMLTLITLNAFTNKSRLFILSIISFLLSAFTTICATSIYQRTNKTRNAIIMIPSVNVKSAPESKSKDLFILHEGTKVEIDQILDNWVNIRIPNGSEGWMEIRNMELI